MQKTQLDKIKYKIVWRFHHNNLIDSLSKGHILEYHCLHSKRMGFLNKRQHTICSMFVLKRKSFYRDIWFHMFLYCYFQKDLLSKKHYMLKHRVCYWYQQNNFMDLSLDNLDLMDIYAHKAYFLDLQTFLDFGGINLHINLLNHHQSNLLDMI